MALARMHGADTVAFSLRKTKVDGVGAKAGEQPINIDVLANDVITLLDALRVPAATLIGVSLGGVTVLNTALLHPSRVQRFIACDTNSSSPESNRKAWNDRIVMAEGDKAVSDVSGEAIVGETLADATTRRRDAARAR